MRGNERLNTSELELLPLGALPLGLAEASNMAPERSTPLPLVLVPNRVVAQGLQRALAERGLSMKTVGNTCQTTAQWLQRLECSPLAMPLAELEPAYWWEPLLRLPLAVPLHLPLWLVLPAGWRQQAVLAHTAKKLRCLPGLITREGA
ncbi:hypothetical protein IQ220_07800 [Cyanobium sp. LEGE 06113]|nr:hypothetical protein [Cyanobium sp. LEGE 06113]